MLKVDAVAITRLNQAEAKEGFLGSRGGIPIGKAINIDIALRLVVVDAGEALWVGSQNVSGVFKSIPSLDAACATSARTIASILPAKNVRGEQQVLTEKRISARTLP